jgi:hypothetical protein
VKKLLIISAVLFSTSAYADDGTWNAGMSRSLPNGTGGSAMATALGATVGGPKPRTPDAVSVTTDAYGRRSVTQTWSK